MAGIKGIGIGAVNSIIEERRNNGPFSDIFNFMERVPSTSVNKKGVEALAYSGAFDSFPEINRGPPSIRKASRPSHTPEHLTPSPRSTAVPLRWRPERGRPVWTC